MVGGRLRGRLDGRKHGHQARAQGWHQKGKRTEVDGEETGRESYDARQGIEAGGDALVGRAKVARETRDEIPAAR